MESAIGKARGFSPDAIDALARRAECDVVLVEADGARGMPLKAPDEHEPCMPESSCCVIAVMGAHLLGKNVGAEQVHRWPQFAGITGLTEDPLTTEGAYSTGSASTGRIQKCTTCQSTSLVPQSFFSI